MNGLTRFIHNMTWLGRERQLAKEWGCERLNTRLAEGKDAAAKVEPYSATRYTLAWCGVCLGVLIVLSGIAVALFYIPGIVIRALLILLGIASVVALVFYVTWSVIEISEHDAEYGSRGKRVREWWASKQQQGTERVRDDI